MEGVLCTCRLGDRLTVSWRPPRRVRRAHPARRDAGCISEDGRGRAPTVMGSADAVDAVTVSPDGKSVYATDCAPRAVQAKQASGAISQPGGAPAA